MKKAIVLHGTLGSPDGNWFRWLESELSGRGYSVWLPELPHPEKPNLKEWCGFVAEQCPFTVDHNTTIIGHSSGAIVALLLAQIGADAGKFIAVSPFDNFDMGWEPNDNLFNDINLDYPKIQKHKQKITIVHSDNDPYIPNESFERIMRGTEAQEILIKNQGHFNLERSEDYTEFPELLNYL